MAHLPHYIVFSFSTSGGMGPEATRYHKRIAELISAKRGEQYSDVVNHIRTRIRFSLLKSVLVAVRGERGERQGKGGTYTYQGGWREEEQGGRMMGKKGDGRRVKGEVDGDEKDYTRIKQSHQLIIFYFVFISIPSEFTS